MNWFEKLFVDTDSIGHIVLIYSLVIAVGVFLGRMKIGGKKNGISLGVTFVLFAGILLGHLYHAAVSLLLAMCLRSSRTSVSSSSSIVSVCRWGLAL